MPFFPIFGNNEDTIHSIEQLGLGANLFVDWRQQKIEATFARPNLLKDLIPTGAKGHVEKESAAKMLILCNLF
jgi:hypothetical protein